MSEFKGVAKLTPKNLVIIKDWYTAALSDCNTEYDQGMVDALHDTLVILHTSSKRSIKKPLIIVGLVGATWLYISYKKEFKVLYTAAKVDATAAFAQTQTEKTPVENVEHISMVQNGAKVTSEIMASAESAAQKVGSTSLTSAYAPAKKATPKKKAVKKAAPKSV